MAKVKKINIALTNEGYPEYHYTERGGSPSTWVDSGLLAHIPKAR